MSRASTADPPPRRQLQEQFGGRGSPVPPCAYIVHLFCHQGNALLTEFMHVKVRSVDLGVSLGYGHISLGSKPNAIVVHACRYPRVASPLPAWPIPLPG